MLNEARRFRPGAAQRSGLLLSLDEDMCRSYGFDQGVVRAAQVEEVRETVRKCGWHARVTQSSSHVNLSNLMKQHQQ